ncbi:phosphoribosylanthranilate isomerase [Limibacter armeniacum]|uniref:phosphoribosylanthranilate isomerase n=1 Tax=Limibacter armeniacum TaxID=466084 RepID=UPI002FE67C7B
MKLKVCGMRDAGNIEALLSLSPDYIGFIFYEKSPRYVGDVLSSELVLRLIPNTVQKVGVFVNMEVNSLLKVADSYKLDVIQLHGNESPEMCKEVKQAGYQVVKVFGVDESFDFSRLAPYEAHVDFFLFDTKSPAHGGTGKTFDWTVLEGYSSDKPFFLSGGISLENIKEVNTLIHPQLYALDVNSRFETAPGLKDISLLEDLKANMI